MALVLIVALTVMFARNSETSDAMQDCGWDLTSVEGVQANSQYLTQTAQWLGSRDPSSLEPPPPPTSPYWHGTCPIDPDADSEPPIHEDDH